MAAVGPTGGAGLSRVFYDGSCGLCHGAVRWLLARDADGTRFRFAPLGGTTFERTFAPGERRALPDSLVVRTPGGRTHVKSQAVRHCLAALGGAWRVASDLSAMVPPPLLDLFYDTVAAVRGRLFRRPEAACPVVPAPLRARFES